LYPGLKKSEITVSHDEDSCFTHAKSTVADLSIKYWCV